jgi:ATP/maltotriose-dependent transcriptional regulator MalT/DNA-binding SARP family transcriptional activator
MADPFLSSRQKARFFPPKQLEGELERSRLLEALQSNIFRKITLLCAAPGYGKTTLAGQFVRSADFPVAWLQLDEGDRDAAVFCEDVLTAFQFAIKDWESPSPALIGMPAVAEKPEALGSAMAGTLDRLLSDFTVLVIDDFHLVGDSPPIQELMNALLREIPSALHLLLISRHIPALRITPLVALQQAAGFSEEHLRFTPAETQELFVVRNHISLPMAEAESLAASNEGWVTGILLSSHLLWKGLPLGGGINSRDQVYHFLASEVLEQQPDPLRHFMLEASVLHDMDPVACDFVLDRKDSRSMLTELDSRRLFVFSSGQEQPAYRFHNLFQEFLRSTLQARDPSKYKALQERSAEWNLKNGFLEVAFSYFVQAENFSLAAKLAEENVLAYYESGRFQILQEWARCLYPFRLEVPTLFGCVAMTYAASGDFPRAEEYLDIAGLGLERSQNTSRLNSLQANRAWLAFRKGDFAAGTALAEDLLRRGKAGGVKTADLRMAACHAGLCADAMGRIQDAVKYLRQSLALYPDGDRSYDKARTLTFLANALHTAGEAAESYVLQRRALALWKELGYPGPIAIALNNLAYDQHMLGQLEESEASYGEAMEWSRKSGDKHSQLLIFSGLGDLSKDRQEYNKAAGFYSAADRLAEDSDDLRMLGYVYRARADLNRRMKNFPAAMEWAHRAGELAEMETAVVEAGDRAFQGAVLEEMGNREEAIVTLARAVDILERESAPAAETAKARFLLARSLFRRGRIADAEGSLRAAFDLAYGCGSDQPLVREASAAADLLEGFFTHATMGGLCASLLDRAVRQIAREDRESRENVFTEPARLSVKALGSLEILWSGKEIPRSAWASPKTKEVFLFLVDRAPVGRDELLTVFWPEMSSGRAQANLYQTLYRIRRAIGTDVLVLKNLVCRFADDLSLEYDVARFEKAARQAMAVPITDPQRLIGLQKANDLFQGEYLKDVAVEWAGQRREEINQIFLTLVREQADEYLSLCRYEDGRAVVIRGLSIDPYRDELHQRMLKILAALGRKHEVVDHYQKYVYLLRKDLGLDPPLETRSLYASLIA